MNTFLSREAARVLSALRPPSSKPLKLVYGFSATHSSLGNTLELEVGEEVVSPGTGQVVGLVKRFSQFEHTYGALDGLPTYEVTIDHGQGVMSVIKGLATTSFQIGGFVQRGDPIGSTLTQEFFLGVSYNAEWLNPQTINRNFRTYGEYVPAQTGKLRQAIDRLIRNLSGNVISVLYNRLRYYIDQITGFKPLLVNVDFNGDGTKVGLAALGLTATDYWNVFGMAAFSWTAGDYYSCCYYGYGYGYSYGYGCGAPLKVFNISPQTRLYDYRHKLSPVWLERVAPASGIGGTQANWDELISNWIGGWSGSLPDENFFSIRGLVAGTYRVACYADVSYRAPATVSTFYASVNSGTPTSKSTAITAVTYWEENANYVTFDLTIPAGGVINLKAYGYFDGLQIQRLS